MVGFCTGRVVIGLISILMALQTLTTSHESYDQSLHELRKTYFPATQSTQAVCSGTKITWEEMNRIVIYIEAGLLKLSGLLIIMNKKCAGSSLFMAAICFIMLIKDNPLIRHSALRTTEKEHHILINEFLKNLGLIGAALLLMLDKSVSVKPSTVKTIQSPTVNNANKNAQKKKGK